MVILEDKEHCLSYLPGQRYIGYYVQLYTTVFSRGVVQLFNAVAKQQKLIDDQMKEAGSSERKRDNVLQGMTKGKFMDVLRSTAGNANTCEKKPKVN